tara:strand:+ start:486 stop:674 length:189 start_codon:yes stop_codon:yes gene_type:complete
MEKVIFKTNKLHEFMYVLKDFEDSLSEWSKNDVANTWGMSSAIGENEYIIYITINEGKNKSK